MKVISVCSGKGGSGKSTIALHLAVAYTKAGFDTAVLDLDQQVSATEWGDRRKGFSPPVITTVPNRLQREIERVRDAGGAVLVIDTPPHNGEAMTIAAKSADLILVPCRPAIMDLNAITSTAVNLASVKAEVFAVLNAVASFGSYADAAEEALKAWNIQVCPVRLGNRIAFQNALVEGQTAEEYEPEGLAALEARQLYNFTTQFVR